MKSDFVIALTQLAAERNLPKEIVISAIEAALASAYRKDTIASGQNISVKLDPGSGDVTVQILKTVVDEVADSETEILLADARQISRAAALGDVISTSSIPHSAGRIAAQTAKQVVMQRLREAERDLVYQEFIERVGEVFPITVQRVEPRHVVVDMARGEAILPHSEQMSSERYRQGQKFKVLLRSVDRTPRGTELIVSRADKDLLRRLFEMEVPEIYNGAVEMVAIAREAGSRSQGRRPSASGWRGPGRLLRWTARSSHTEHRQRTAGREDRHPGVEQGHSAIHRQLPESRPGDAGRTRPRHQHRHSRRSG